MILLIMRQDMGTFLAVPMEEKKAKGILNLWKSGGYGMSIITGDEEGGWAIRADKISLMHLQPIGQGQMLPLGVGARTSGL